MINEEQMKRLEPIPDEPGWFVDPVTGEAFSEADLIDSDDQDDDNSQERPEEDEQEEPDNEQGDDEGRAEEDPEKQNKQEEGEDEPGDEGDAGEGGDSLEGGEGGAEGATEGAEGAEAAGEAGAEMAGEAATTEAAAGSSAAASGGATAAGGGAAAAGGGAAAAGGGAAAAGGGAAAAGGLAAAGPWIAIAVAVILVIILIFGLVFMGMGQDEAMGVEEPTSGIPGMPSGDAASIMERGCYFKNNLAEYRPLVMCGKDITDCWGFVHTALHYGADPEFTSAGCVRAMNAPDAIERHDNLKYGGTKYEIYPFSSAILQPGDMLFNTTRGSHAGLYIGEDYCLCGSLTTIQASLGDHAPICKGLGSLWDTIVRVVN